jgi:membrane protease YdiL (CAAX protease family)
MTPLADRPLGATLSLHFVPGILMTAAYLALVPAMRALGLPPMFGLLLATLFVMIPVELGYLFYQARRRNGSRSLDGVVPLRDPLPAKQYVLWTIVFFVWGLASSALANPLEATLRHTLFGWLPGWYAPTSAAEFAPYSKAAVGLTFGVGIVVVGIAGPIVEELYFRGHLLPRLGRFGRWAPALNATLFSLYHLWTPWQNPSRILLMVPLTQLVWTKRNVYLGMGAHCTLNAIVWTITFGALYAAHP